MAAFFFADKTSFSQPCHDFYMGQQNPQGAPTYAVVADDLARLTTFNSAVPVAASVPAPVNVDPVCSYGGAPTICRGWYAVYKNIGAGAVTFTPVPGVVIDTFGSVTLTQGQSFTLFSNGVNYWTF